MAKPDEPWYLEIYKKKGTKAERHWTESDFSEVVRHVTAARIDPDHILRVRSPIDASKEQLQKIQDLGGQLF
jgi:hypothetical protein